MMINISNHFARRLAPLAVLVVVMLSAQPAFAQTPLALDEMLAKFIANIQGPLLTLLNAGSYAVGALFVMKGLLKAIKFTDEGARGQQKSLGIASTLIIGAALLALPNTLNMMSDTLLGGSGNASSNNFNALVYPDGTDGSMTPEEKAKIENTTKAVLAFVQIIGLIGFVKGLALLRSATDGNTQASVAAALTHIIGGAMAWNMVHMVNIISETVGVHILT